MGWGALLSPVTHAEGRAGPLRFDVLAARHQRHEMLTKGGRISVSGEFQKTAHLWGGRGYGLGRPVWESEPVVGIEECLTAPGAGL